MGVTALELLRELVVTCRKIVLREVRGAGVQQEARQEIISIRVHLLWLPQYEEPPGLNEGSHSSCVVAVFVSFQRRQLQRTSGPDTVSRELTNNVLAGVCAPACSTVGEGSIVTNVWFFGSGVIGGTLSLAGPSRAQCGRA